MAENREYLSAAQKGGVIHISEEVIVSKIGRAHV